MTSGDTRRSHDPSQVAHLVGEMVRALVDDEDAVDVTAVVGAHSVVLELTVDKSDVGKVIGKKGAHAQALRTIMAAAGGRQKMRYLLEIIEP